MSVIRGHVREVVLKHDASRIVQTVVKYGTPAERDEIAAELKGKYKELAQNRYSKVRFVRLLGRGVCANCMQFLVSKLIRLCPTHRASILSEFQGSLVRLLLHREASGVLADAFELYANAYERSLLLRDFYGKEAQMFSVTTGTEEDKERGKRGLQGLLDGADPERRRRLMGAIKESLLNMCVLLYLHRSAPVLMTANAPSFNNSDKGAITHAIVHRVLWEYLAAVNDLPDEAEQERLRREVFDTYVS
jgi:pumilio family protein 6